MTVNTAILLVLMALALVDLFQQRRYSKRIIMKEDDIIAAEDATAENLNKVAGEIADLIAQAQEGDQAKLDIALAKANQLRDLSAQLVSQAAPPTA